MTNFLDKLEKLQQAWQLQSGCGIAKMDPDQWLKMNPDQLLKTARLERRMYFWIDMFLISVFVSIGGGMFWWTFIIHKEWPMLIYTACLAWVVGYILFNRWRQRRHTAHYDEPLLAHVEWAIKDIELRMRLERTQTFWYILPIALGCIIPSVISFAMDFLRSHEWNVLFELLFTVGFFVTFFYFIDRFMKGGLWFSRAVRMGREAQHKELEALRALRESLLNEESGK